MSEYLIPIIGLLGSLLLTFATFWLNQPKKSKALLSEVEALDKVKDLPVELQNLRNQKLNQIAILDEMVPFTKFFNKLATRITFSFFFWMVSFPVLLVLIDIVTSGSLSNNIGFLIASICLFVVLLTYTFLVAETILCFLSFKINWIGKMLNYKIDDITFEPINLNKNFKDLMFTTATVGIIFISSYHIVYLLLPLLALFVLGVSSNSGIVQNIFNFLEDPSGAQWLEITAFPLFLLALITGYMTSKTLLLISSRRKQLEK